MLDDPARRAAMGRNGMEWVNENFDRKVVWGRLIEVYEQQLSRAKR